MFPNFIFLRSLNKSQVKSFIYFFISYSHNNLNVTATKPFY